MHYTLLHSHYNFTVQLLCSACLGMGRVFTCKYARCWTHFNNVVPLEHARNFKVVLSFTVHVLAPLHQGICIGHEDQQQSFFQLVLVPWSYHVTVPTLYNIVTFSI